MRHNPAVRESQPGAAHHIPGQSQVVPAVALSVVAGDGLVLDDVHRGDGAVGRVERTVGVQSGGSVENSPALLPLGLDSEDLVLDGHETLRLTTLLGLAGHLFLLGKTPGVSPEVVGRHSERVPGSLRVDVTEDQFVLGDQSCSREVHPTHGLFDGDYTSALPLHIVAVEAEMGAQQSHEFI